jgi:hypothetical protein
MTTDDHGDEGVRVVRQIVLQARRTQRQEDLLRRGVPYGRVA